MTQRHRHDQLRRALATIGITPDQHEASGFVLRLIEAGAELDAQAAIDAALDPAAPPAGLSEFSIGQRLIKACELADGAIRRAQTQGVSDEDLGPYLRALYRRAAWLERDAAIEIRGALRGLLIAGGLWQGQYDRDIGRLNVFMGGL